MNAPAETQSVALEGSMLDATALNPLRRSAPSLYADCVFDTASLQAGWPTFAVAHYANSSAYDRFDGEDLTPWNHDKFNSASDFAKRLKLSWSEAFTYQFCRLEHSGEQGVWHVQRVGPFVSTGGYDWWQVSGRKAALLPTDGGSGVFIVESFVGAVDASGEPLAYPPMHLHHIHVGSEKAKTRFNSWYMLGTPYGYSNDLVLERHGEWNFIDDPVVSAEAEPRGYGRAVTFPLDIDGELNDVRPAGSAAMTWSFQVAVRWVSGSASLRPVSTINILNSRCPAPHLQGTYEAYFFVPPYVPTVSWMSSTLGQSQEGELLHVKSHTHMNLLLKVSPRPDPNPHPPQDYHHTRIPPPHPQPHRSTPHTPEPPLRRRFGRRRPRRPLQLRLPRGPVPTGRCGEPVRSRTCHLHAHRRRLRRRDPPPRRHAVRLPEIESEMLISRHRSPLCLFLSPPSGRPDPGWQVRLV